jgi:hypothetical protein
MVFDLENIGLLNLCIIIALELIETSRIERNVAFPADGIMWWG